MHCHNINHSWLWILSRRSKWTAGIKQMGIIKQTFSLNDHVAAADQEVPQMAHSFYQRSITCQRSTINQMSTQTRRVSYGGRVLNQGKKIQFMAGCFRRNHSVLTHKVLLCNQSFNLSWKQTFHILNLSFKKKNSLSPLGLNQSPKRNQLFWYNNTINNRLHFNRRAKVLCGGSLYG